MLSAALLTVGLTLSGCVNQVSMAGAPGQGETKKLAVEKSFTRFPDMPIPVKANIDLERTLVFGGDETWSGRLTITSAHHANDMFDFYKQELPGYGWSEIATVRSKISVLTYSRNDRIATIQIQGITLGGSETMITASPRDAQKAPAPLDAPVTPAPLDAPLDAPLEPIR